MLKGSVRRQQCVNFLTCLCAVFCWFGNGFLQRYIYRYNARTISLRSVLVPLFSSGTITSPSVLETKPLGDGMDNVTATRSRNVQFISPLLEYGYLPAISELENQTLSDKPLLLYLPGFDGTFLSPFLQFPELHTIFDIRCMTVAMDDRSTLEELQSDVLQYLENECKKQPSIILSQMNESTTTKNVAIKSYRDKRNTTAPNRQKQQRRRSVYLAGESFGGILASIVSIKLVQEPSNNYCLKGLTLINAATCYDRSKLAIDGPSVAQLQDFSYPFGLIGRLLPLFTDKYSITQLLLILQAKALPSIIDNSCREAYMGRVAFSLPFVLKFMPKETLQWRLSSWLDAGCEQLASADKPLEKLKDLRTLIIAGENDAALPSIAEAERLAGILKNSLVHVVQGAGHASTCGSRVDLAALFRLRFEELRPKGSKVTTNPFIFWQQTQNQSEQVLLGRTSMKKDAESGQGSYFGMEPRYDDAKVGLNPLRYWSDEYYKKYLSPIIQSDSKN